MGLSELKPAVGGSFPRSRTRVEVPDQRTLQSPTPARTKTRTNPEEALAPERRSPLVAISAASGVMVVVGLYYIYGFALVTQEGYHYARLHAMVINERNIAKQLSQERTRLQFDKEINRRTRSLGMGPADESQAVIVGRPLATPSKTDQ